MQIDSVILPLLARKNRQVLVINGNDLLGRPWHTLAAAFPAPIGLGGRSA